MTTQQALDEQETTFTIEATDRDVLYIFSNDSVWIKRIEALGIQPNRQDGYGRWYKVDLENDFNFGIHRKQSLTEERRAELSERMRKLREAQ